MNKRRTRAHSHTRLVSFLDHSFFLISLSFADVYAPEADQSLGHLAPTFAHPHSVLHPPDPPLRSGAHHFLTTNDAEAVQAALGSFKFILATISASSADWDLYLRLLAPGGTLCLVGIPNEIRFNPMGLVGRQLTLAGSYLCSNENTRSMLEFCAEHGIMAKVEVLPMNAANAQLALEKVDRNEPRYRMVLVNEEHPNNKKQQE